MGIKVLYFFLPAEYDYIPSNFTLIFTPSNMMKSRQCVQIEIIDDSLAEFWEVFTVLLSTNSSAVDLTLNKFDIYISPNDGKKMCIHNTMSCSPNQNPTCN